MSTTTETIEYCTECDESLSNLRIQEGVDLCADCEFCFHL